ncbi:serine/arginine repetitive matrix protein 1-like, partial [Plectropomus leopardus]|uniref:serine/arginine repetitive matrix protein 1-like n=1 Tax=Plectropomus leopardus TaxID=160734 RepID=UPI001C4D2DDE
KCLTCFSPPQPPPSYEEVIREKTQEQVLRPPPSSSSSSRPASITIATQTDPGSAPDPQDASVRRPVRPPRPPHPRRPSHVDDVATTASQSAVASLNGDGAHTPCCDLLSDLCPPLTSTSGAQTDSWDQSVLAVDVATPSSAPSQRPRPRPRSRLSAPPPITSDVKVQTLVKLSEDGLATLAARARSDGGVSQGKYLQELLEAFSSDDWGFPDRRSDSSEHSQSESEDEDEDMATLKARIQAFEQQQQQVADGSCGDRDFVVAKKPEPRPRPRLQGQPAKSAPPTVAPKPKNFSPKPSSKVFWEDDGLTAGGAETSADLNPQTETPKPAAAPGPPKNTEKPAVSPKPQSASDPLLSAPVPAPRPPPPKLTPSVGETPPTAKAPPRPPVAPRTSVGAPPQDRSAPTLPPRPSVEVSGEAQKQMAGGEETPDAAKQSGECSSLK